jgi:hypothetical protein
LTSAFDTGSVAGASVVMILMASPYALR